MKEMKESYFLMDTPPKKNTILLLLFNCLALVIMTICLPHQGKVFHHAITAFLEVFALGTFAPTKNYNFVSHIAQILLSTFCLLITVSLVCPSVRDKKLRRTTHVIYRITCTCALHPVLCYVLVTIIQVILGCPKFFAPFAILIQLLLYQLANPSLPTSHRSASEAMCGYSKERKLYGVPVVDGTGRECESCHRRLLENSKYRWRLGMCPECRQDLFKPTDDPYWQNVGSKHGALLPNGYYPTNYLRLQKISCNPKSKPLKLHEELAVGQKYPTAPVPYIANKEGVYPPPDSTDVKWGPAVIGWVMTQCIPTVFKSDERNQYYALKNRVMLASPVPHTLGINVAAMWHTIKDRCFEMGLFKKVEEKLKVMKVVTHNTAKN